MNEAHPSVSFKIAILFNMSLPTLREQSTGIIYQEIGSSENKDGYGGAGIKEEDDEVPRPFGAAGAAESLT